MEKQQNDIITFENLLKIAPGLFLFFGFVYLYSYLNLFDLQASNIYGLDEIFLVFLPIFEVIWPIGILIFIVWLTIFLLSEMNGRPFLRRFRMNSLSGIVDSEFREKFHRITRKKKIILRLVMRILLSSTVIFFIGLVFMNQRLEKEVDPIEIFFLDIFIAGFCFDLLIILRQYKPKIKLQVRPLLIIICVPLFFFFTKGMAKAVAQETIKNKSHVSFVYEGKAYTTTKDTICIVNSRNFIVLRTLSKSENTYFEKDKIKLLTTQELPHK